MSTPYQHRKRWWGFTNMGAIQIPPNPQPMVLTDRGTGEQWWVTFNTSLYPSSDGYGYVAIQSVLPCNQVNDAPAPGQLNPRARPYNNCHFYDAYDEPIIGYLDATHTQYARLIVRNGFLGVDVIAVNPQAGWSQQAPSLDLLPDTGLLGFNGQFDTIILSITEPGWYAWYATTLTQTPNPPPYIPGFSQQNDD